MKSRTKYVLGMITVTAIIGGTIYAIKKSKEVKKNNDNVISLEEARKIVEDERPEVEETVKFTQEIEVIDEPKSIKIVTDEDVEEEDFDETEDGVVYTVEPLRDFVYIEDGIDPKEDKTLRFEPSSDAAKHQFIRMELAEWNPSDDVYRIMLQLFEIPFIPRNPGDEMLRTKIVDYKVQFFGFESKWSKEVSFADVIFYYGKHAEYNCGDTVREWVDLFCVNIGMEWDLTSEQMDIIINRLNSHSYFNDQRQTFGLFGLTREQMDNAIRTSNKNYDKSVTYDVEFNEFLMGVME